MRILRVVFHRSRWVLVEFCRWGVCCLYRGLICVRVTSTFWWGYCPVVSVWWRCVYARWAFFIGAALDTWALLFEGVGLCWCGSGDIFLFAWWMWCVLTYIHWLSFSILQASFVSLVSWFVVCVKRWVDHCLFLLATGVYVYTCC
jgi:hypothetical protein